MNWLQLARPFHLKPPWQRGAIKLQSWNGIAWDIASETNGGHTIFSGRSETLRISTQDFVRPASVLLSPARTTKLNQGLLLHTLLHQNVDFVGDRSVDGNLGPRCPRFGSANRQFLSVDNISYPIYSLTREPGVTDGKAD
jgi:hypothetical protein